MQGKKVREFSFLLGLGLSFIALFFSAFLTSLGTAILGLSLILRRKDLKDLSFKWWVLYLAPIVFLLFDLLRTDNYTVVSMKIVLMFGFAVCATAVMLYGDVIKKYQLPLLLLWLALIFIVNSLSVGNYFLHQAQLDQLLLQSKAIPIFGGMHHIHFGILNAITILIITYLLLFHNDRKYKTYLGVYLAFLLFSFHVLSSRTGLVSLYASLSFCLLVYAVLKKEYKNSALIILAVIGVNAVAFTFSSSFKSKFANSVEDIDSWDRSEDINYKSMGMRLESYKNCLSIIKSNPIIGVGAGDMNREIQKTYVERNTVLYMDNRIGPHNQFLEYGVKYGIVGIIFLLFFFLFWIQKAWKPLDILMLSAVLLLFFSSQFESLLERQVSLFFTAVLFPILRNGFSSEN